MLKSAGFAGVFFVPKNISWNIPKKDRVSFVNKETVRTFGTSINYLINNVMPIRTKIEAKHLSLVVGVEIKRPESGGANVRIQLYGLWYVIDSNDLSTVLNQKPLTAVQLVEFVNRHKLKVENSDSILSEFSSQFLYQS